MEERGQTLIIAAMAMVALIGMLLLIINAGALLLDYMALQRAAEDAALAALQPSHVGQSQLNITKAQERARDVLTMELVNLKGLQDAKAEVADSATVSVMNPQSDGCVWIDGTCYEASVVRIVVSGDVCPPVWQCVTLQADRTVSLDAVIAEPAAATPVPGMTIQVTPTPAP